MRTPPGSYICRMDGDPAQEYPASQAQGLLDSDEFDVWRVFVASSRLLIAELDRHLRRDVGIPHSWFMLLIVLSERPGSTARQTDLASITDFSLSRLSHAITRMQEQGWVYRQSDPDDRRAADVVLTADGAAAVQRIRREHDAALRELFFAKMTRQDAEQLRRVCRNLLPGLRGAPISLTTAQAVD